MPPVPISEKVPLAILSNFLSSTNAFEMSSALLFFLGSSVNKPFSSVKSRRQSASTRFDTIAAKLSLSPNLISSVATVSFSLITGITLSEISLQIVDLAFKYLFLSLRSSCVNKICAAIRLF